MKYFKLIYHHIFKKLDTLRTILGTHQNAEEITGFSCYLLKCSLPSINITCQTVFLLLWMYLSESPKIHNLYEVTLLLLCIFIALKILCSLSSHSFLPFDPFPPLTLLRTFIDMCLQYIMIIFTVGH